MGTHGSKQRAIVIDMSASFGWTGSPSYYGTFGSAISWLVALRRSSNTVAYRTMRPFSYEWVDDHILVEVATPGRLQAAETCLRLAMLAVLGLRSISDAKFSTWCTTLEVLGLQFNTIAKTVTMPKEKVTKSIRRPMKRKSTVARHDLEYLLGSMCHVTCLLRAAKGFFQRIHTAVKRLLRKGGFQLSDAIRLDL
ncbi:LOW QUALITY PROTEIN: hypothetical protein PHMEG_00027552 [Phytophthora megakarya]|uniref:Uncharacterized protein n=1 Tax=Phytophthora megakarya TaxID=4795 RepID=A0A225V6Z9_9STRA|nr:LOW QUALITY PROTEIN: hypothetical protein PHMEG_00027552 [Phytophthora megakarya]